MFPATEKDPSVRWVRSQYILIYWNFNGNYLFYSRLWHRWNQVKSGVLPMPRWSANGRYSKAKRPPNEPSRKSPPSWDSSGEKSPISAAVIFKFYNGRVWGYRGDIRDYDYYNHLLVICHCQPLWSHPKMRRNPSNEYIASYIYISIKNINLCTSLFFCYILMW